MLGSLLASTVDRGPYNHWNIHLTSKNIRPIGSLIHNWIDREQHEIHSRMEHDRTHPSQGRAYCGSCGSIFGDRRIYNSFATKFLFEFFKACARIPGAPNT